MPTDRYGLPLTTGSPAAARAWIDGADRVLAADSGALAAFDRAIEADPGFALAHVGRARVLQVLAHGAEARESAARARSCANGASDREKGLVDALATMIAGDAPGALERIRAHVGSFPRDAFVLHPATNVFGLIGFSGRAGREREVLDLLASLAGDYGDDWWFVGTLGFWHTETGDPATGLEMNRRSLEANPRNANAMHGLAHAHYERGDAAGGLEALARFLPGYDRSATLHCHLSWHAAIFELGDGRPERAWAIYADAIAPGASALAPPLNTITDAASFLWRAMLFAEAVDVARWREVRDFGVERFPARGVTFADVHCALAHAMAGDDDALDRIVSDLREADAAGRLPAGAAAPAAAQGLAAFARGDDEAAIARIEPRLDELVRVGGSQAQRDLFSHTLLAAYLRSGRAERAAALAERNPWRAARHEHALLARAGAA